MCIPVSFVSLVVPIDKTQQNNNNIKENVYKLGRRAVGWSLAVHWSCCCCSPEWMCPIKWSAYVNISTVHVALRCLPAPLEWVECMCSGRAGEFRGGLRSSTAGVEPKYRERSHIEFHGSGFPAQILCTNILRLFHFPSEAALGMWWNLEVSSIHRKREYCVRTNASCSFLCTAHFSVFVVNDDAGLIIICRQRGPTNPQIKAALRRVWR